jgi:hypothetical protein
MQSAYGAKLEFDTFSNDIWKSIRIKLSFFGPRNILPFVPRLNNTVKHIQSLISKYLQGLFSS